MKLKIILFLFIIFFSISLIALPQIKVIDGISSWVRTVDFSNDSQFVVSASDDYTINLWDINRAKLIFSKRAHDNIIKEVHYSKDNSLIISASLDNTIKIWDSKTLELINTITLEDRINCAEISKDNKLIAAGLTDSRIIMIDWQNNKIIKQIKGHTNSIISLKFLDDNSLISAGWDNTIRKWDINTGKEILKINTGIPRLNCMAISGEKGIVSTGGSDSKIKIWELKTGKWITTLSGHTNEITCLDFSENGFLATGSKDNTIKIWDINNFILINTLSGHKNQILCLKYSPNNQFIVSGGIDRLMKLWDTKVFDCIFTSIHHGNNDFISWTLDSFFYGTEEAIKKYLLLTDGNNYYKLENFFNILFRPDVITARIMKLADDSKLTINRIKDLSIPDSPKIYAQLKDDSFTNNSEKIKSDLKIDNNNVKIKIPPQNRPVDKILIYQNDKLINNIPGESLSRGIDNLIELNLSNDKNIIKAVTVNKENIESNPVELVLPRLNNNYKPKAYIFGVGINEYQDEKLKLKYSISDIKDVINNLKACTKNIYKETEIIELYNDDCKKEKIDNNFKNLISKINTDDLFIFLYAGHGYSNISTNNDFIMILQDNSILYSNELINYLTKIKAIKQIVSIDSCHSGSLVENIKFCGSLEEKSLASLSRYAGFAIYAATTSQNQAVESEKIKHGIYTYTLMQAINGNAADKNGYYFIEGLGNFLKIFLPANSIKLLSIVQYPIIYTFGYNFYFGRSEIKENKN